MANVKPGSYWLAASFILAIALIVAGFVVWLRYEPDHPVEISMLPTPNHTGTIYIGGAVANPGLYPFSAADSIESLIRAAGGITGSTNLSNVKLSFIPDSEAGPQRIDINRAEPWLLEALPGIGETLAQRVVDYREQNGPFHSTADLLKVNGMGLKTYQQIENLITAGE